MKLLQLRYFYEACRHNNITRAAEELHVSQPSISNAIKELETEFGITLFHRLNKGFSLTKEGKIFMEHAESLLTHADNISHIMEDMGHKRNMLRIGIPPMIGTFLFPKIYRGFKEKYPSVNIVTQEQGTQSLIEAIEDETLDMAIVPSNNLSGNMFHILNLTQTETVFCTAPNHKLAGEQMVTIPMIQNEPLILFHNGFFQNDVITQLFSKYGAVPNVIHYSSQLYTMKEFIAGGIACGFLFKDIVQLVSGVAGIPLSNPIHVQISLVWKKNNYMFNDMVRFINYVKKIF
ncbi:LysR family transcriptional regulator [Anaerocolumna xylanovorans]|uniref:DNA-binding transcriptional regulator, LysR family n=1 Tax=Anaerocolumna xylanovorans DSM 12503 TaxID=1121345 RepID=A0A1M7YP25_9FIRM|nr:LysR family transcriptional regulator [Anaerocolumna xylanovorans]SHO54236.1 DNA-binding transcriptional regulator, LysR family [Anaerocolumna xylanovorans DSM 12503]